MATAKKASSKTAAKPAAWKSLKHARGPATRVPAQVDQLVNPGPPTQGENPYWVLRDTLVGNGVWFDASAPAVALLLDTVEKAGDPTPLFAIAADILGGDQLRGWLAPPAAPADGHEKAAHDAAVERKAVLLGGLGAKLGVARAAAAMALAMVPGLAAESVPALVKVATGDADEVARAAALLALGRLGIGDAAAAGAIDSARREGAPKVVRGAAGLAWLRQDDKRAFDQAKDELLQWLGYLPAEGVDLPWFKCPFWYRSIGFPDGTARAVSGLGKARGKAGIEALGSTAVALAEAPNGPAEAQLAKIMLDLGGFSSEAPPPSVVLPAELTEDQRAIAKKLAGTHLLPVGGYGLPASGAVRRRWAGLDPAGPLDRRLESAGGPAMPLWRALQTRAAEPGDFSSPLDRWQSLVELGSGSYPPSFRAPRLDQVDGELAAVPVNDELFERAARLGDDLAARFAAAARASMNAPLYPNVSMLFLSPMVRANRPIPEAWDLLFPIGAEPQSRELFAALPPERRERALIAKMRSGGAATRWAFGRLALALIDLAPTKNVAETLRWLIGEVAKGPNSDGPVAELTTGLAEAMKKHPGLAAA